MVTEGTSEEAVGAPGTGRGSSGPGAGGLVVMSLQDCECSHVPGPASAWPGTLSPGAKGLHPWEPQFPHHRKQEIGYSGCQSTGRNSPRLPKHQTGVPQVSVPTLWLAELRAGLGSLSWRVERPATDPAAVGFPSPGHRYLPRGSLQDGLRQLGSRAAHSCSRLPCLGASILGPGDTAWH